MSLLATTISRVSARMTDTTSIRQSCRGYTEQQEHEGVPIHEALANLIAFAEEKPHLKVDSKVKIRYDNEEEVMNRLMARYLQKSIE